MQCNKLRKYANFQIIKSRKLNKEEMYSQLLASETKMQEANARFKWAALESGEFVDEIRRAMSMFKLDTSCDFTLKITTHPEGIDLTLRNWHTVPLLLPDPDDDLLEDPTQSDERLSKSAGQVKRGSNTQDPDFDLLEDPTQYELVSATAVSSTTDLHASIHRAFGVRKVPSSTEVSAIDNHKHAFVQCDLEMNYGCPDACDSLLYSAYYHPAIGKKGFISECIQTQPFDQELRPLPKASIALK